MTILDYVAISVLVVFKRMQRTADGFAVCGFMATLAKYFDPLQAPQIDPAWCWSEDVPA
jgi:hypothetical protein